MRERERGREDELARVSTTVPASDGYNTRFSLRLLTQGWLLGNGLVSMATGLYPLRGVMEVRFLL